MFRNAYQRMMEVDVEGIVLKYGSSGRCTERKDRRGSMKTHIVRREG